MYWWWRVRSALRPAAWLIVVVVLLSLFGKSLIPGVLAALGVPSWLCTTLWIACALAVLAAVVTGVAVRLRRFLDQQREEDNVGN